MSEENKDNTEISTCHECGEEYPLSELKQEVYLGNLCPYCICSLKLNGKKLTFKTEVKNDK